MKVECFVRSNKVERSFVELKKQITRTPVLALQNFNLLFKVYYDAFNVGTSVVLN